MKHVKPIDPVSTWHLLNESEENATYYVSSLLKANKNNDQYEQNWFPTPDKPGDEEYHTPIQARIQSMPVPSLRRKNLMGSYDYWSS